MAELAVITKQLDFHLEQVQDFTPTPMTVATEMWYTGYDPYTMEPVFSARTQRDKLAQRQYFFWYKPEERRGIEQSLRRIGRPDLISRLFGSQFPASNEANRANGANGTHKPNKPQQPHHYNPPQDHAHHRAKHNSEKPREEKRGRNRRH